MGPPSGGISDQISDTDWQTTLLFAAFGGNERFRLLIIDISFNDWSTVVVIDCQVMDYLLWASMCVESSIQLVGVKYLSWRSTMYSAVCQCYCDIKQHHMSEVHSFDSACILVELLYNTNKYSYYTIQIKVYIVIITSLPKVIWERGPRHGAVGHVRRKVLIGYNGAPQIRPQKYPFLWTDPQTPIRHFSTMHWTDRLTGRWFTGKFDDYRPLRYESGAAS